jgi:hypothetical protein
MKYRLKEDKELVVLDCSIDYGHPECFQSGTEFTEIAACRSNRYRILGLGTKRVYVPESTLSTAFEAVWEETKSTTAPWRTADEPEAIED